MVKIRKIRKSDAGAIVKILRTFVRFAHTLGDVKINPLTEKSYLELAFGPKRAFDGLIVLDDKNKAIGYMLYSFGLECNLYRRYITLEDLFVVKSERGHGLGRRLMQKLSNIAHAEDCVQIRISVWDKNPEAMKFYKKLGFKNYSSIEEKYVVRELVG
ncbi:MAG: GNAT family N-acetyltransferase [Alphaproteobacteria bacterium]|nr:GNAT family N-acetyltransferase [Alphaproteobacteria bacterium]